MSLRLYRGGRRVESIPADHRGIAYGDGLFETMRAHGGAVPWRDRHLARLRTGARCLGIALPDAGFVAAEIDAMAAQSEGVLKLVLSRGAGGRGYAPSPQAEPDWQLSSHPLPASPPAGGIALRWCDLRLSAQPALAGLKHCNRLEQVLARAEWTDPDIHEGLLRDADGDVIGATAANVFALVEGRWITPGIGRCGIAGVCRGWAIEALDAREGRLSRPALEAAEAVFLCNAVRGILPVAQLDARRWTPHPRIADAQRLLAAAHPAFA